MTTQRFVPNPMLAEELKRATFLLDDMQRAAEAIADAARGLAPEEFGDYKDGIEAEAGTDAKGVLGRVNANDWKSGLIEFGAGEGRPVFAPLRKGAEAAGFGTPRGEGSGTE